MVACGREGDLLNPPARVINARRLRVFFTRLLILHPAQGARLLEECFKLIALESCVVCPIQAHCKIHRVPLSRVHVMRYDLLRVLPHVYLFCIYAVADYLRAPKVGRERVKYKF